MMLSTPALQDLLAPQSALVEESHLNERRRVCRELL